MSEIQITKRDIGWGYIAQFFSIASGLITLPLILKMLSAEEIGMNYLMLTIGALVSLFDFGFAPQFGRNITYVFCGAQELKKEGVDVNNGTLNYRLLATMISVAKSVYQILSLIVLVVMLTVGTVYIYKVTDGFSNVSNSFIIWVVYSISVFFNVYYTYYASLLIGKGLIMESKKAMIASKLVYIFLTFTLLFTGLGLLGVALANLIAPFVGRFFSYRYFFTADLLEKISLYHITKQEKLDLFKIIWYNAKKLGAVFVGSYVINKLGFFLAGLYLSLEDIASYGLMIQLISVITMVAVTLFTVSEPRFSALRVEGEQNKLIKNFAFTMNVFYFLFFCGCLLLIAIAPTLLKLIGSNTTLPNIWILILYSIVVLLENNHSSFATLIVTDNKIPFVESSLITGCIIALGSFFSLQYTSMGILGLVIIQGFCQLVYSNWKWPYVVCREFTISYMSFLAIGMRESLNKIKLYYDR